MKKIYFKFALSLVLLINMLIFILFFEDLIYVVEPYLYPLFFIYFIIDSFGVILPMYNHTIYSSKMQKKRFKEVPSYDKENVRKAAKKQNKQAMLIFVLYTLLIVSIGVFYQQVSWFGKPYLYLVFFALNFADYFCILIWCPFARWFLKNSCCNTCRISNWDRIMKFSILVFIPNIYTITIFILGVLIFLYWEYHHLVHPERFYRISNQTLWCSNCDTGNCEKPHKNKKERP